MKYFLMLLVFFTAMVESQAQEPQYTWGKPITNYAPDRQITKLLEQGDNGFLLLSEAGGLTNKTHHLEFFDTELNQVRDIQIEFDGGIMGDMNTIQEVITIGTRHFLFWRNWNKTNQKHSFYISTLFEDGTHGESKLLVDVNASKINNSGFFKITVSEDERQLLLLTELPAEKKMQEQIKLKCFGTISFDELWSKNITLKTPSQRAPDNEIRIDNQGNVFLFKTIRKLDAFYELFVSHKGEDWNSIPLDLDGKVVTDFKMQFDQKNEFHLNGLYTDNYSNYKTIVDGRFYVHLNQELKPVVNFTKTWNANEVPDFAIGNNLSLDNYHLKDVLFRRDGKMLLLIEQLKYDSDIIAGSSPLQSMYEWKYGPMLVLCMDPNNGDIEWSQGFRKEQENKNMLGVDQFGSVVYYLNDDRLYMYWNNTELSKATIPPASWKEPDGTRYVKHKAFAMKTAHATFLRIINPDGSFTYDRTFGLPLFNFHEGASFDMSMNSHFFFPYSNGIVIRAEMHNGGQRFRWGLISF